VSSNPDSPSTGHPVQATLLVIAALFLFACTDTITKFLAMRHPVPFVLAIRYIFLSLLMAVLFVPTRGKALVQVRRTGLTWLRGGSLALISLFVGLALSRMPVAETTAINFLAPMLVILLAGPLLNERIGAVGWFAAGSGFLGVLLITRPGSGLDPAGVAFALCAVAASVLYQLLSRILAVTERTLTLLFYTALAGAIGFGVLLPWYWAREFPGPMDTLMFLAVGITGGLGHYLYTAAYRHAEAARLAPLNYLQLVWAALLGWVVFGHVPDMLSLLGMGIVIASGMVMTLRGHSRLQAGTQPKGSKA